MTKTMNISANPSQPCTFASRTSQRTDQSLQKSMSASTHTKNDRQTSGRKEARLPNINPKNSLGIILDAQKGGFDIVHLIPQPCYP